MSDGGLVGAVDSASDWAGSGTALALRELALELARELTYGGAGDKPAPSAQLAKELRGTLEKLEEMRDGDDAGASLGVVLSSPVWDGKGSGSGDAGTSRGEGGRESG